MENFMTYYEEYFPFKNIRIKVGATITFIGVNSEGLAHLKPAQIEWLNSHKIMHAWLSKNEVELIYRSSPKYEKIVWGK